MKRILTIIIAAFALMSAHAAAYKLDELKNPQLADSTRFVANPDGVLSPQAEQQINQMLLQLRRNTSAEIAVVAVNDFDSDADIEEFATDLFRKWGIGKKDTNNGLLFLIAKDRHQARLRTGMGVEGLLPDGYLGTVMDRQMVPRFKQDDYDGGTIATLQEIVNTLSTPEAREEIMSKYGTGSSDEDIDAFYFYLWICGFLAIGSLIWALAVAWRSGNESRTERYAQADKLWIPMIIITIFGLGIPLISLLIVYFWRHDLRRGKHICANCGSRMNLVDEVHDNDYLTREQDIEERLGTVDYDVWLCPTCGETDIIPYDQKASAYTVCPVCKAKALHVISDRVVKQPTTRSEGLRAITSHCASCGFEDTKTAIIAKTVASGGPIIIPGGGGHGGSFGGGGFGGGSFGGGFTAGGGAGRSW